MCNLANIPEEANGSNCIASGNRLSRAFSGPSFEMCGTGGRGGIGSGRGGTCLFPSPKSPSFHLAASLKLGVDFACRNDFLIPD